MTGRHGTDRQGVNYRRDSDYNSRGSVDALGQDTMAGPPAGRHHSAEKEFNRLFPYSNVHYGKRNSHPYFLADREKIGDK
jgi:hypothetical protein